MDLVSIDHADGVAVVTVSSPPLGLVDRRLVGALDASIAALAEDVGVRVIILTGGQDDIFLSHWSIQEIAEADDVGVLCSQLAALCARLETCPKPVIAALNGSAVGAGLELALAADIRILEPGDHQLGLLDLNLGLVPMAGGSLRLTRLIGEARALELILMGRGVTPAEAVQIGLVNEVATERAIDAALVMARRLADQFGPAIARAKSLIRHSARLSMADGLNHERTAFHELFSQARPRQLISDVRTGKRSVED